jgi:hypothetical protein
MCASDSESDGEFMKAWSRLQDGTEALTPEIINEGFECFCDPRGYLSGDLVEEIWWKDGIRDRLEEQVFVDYDSAFRTWSAFFFNLAKYTANCKRGWGYNFPLDQDLSGIYEHLSQREKHKKFEELEIPTMISGFAREAVESNCSVEFSALYAYCAMRKCDNEDHSEDIENCDCKENEGLRTLFFAQGHKHEELQGFLRTLKGNPFST